MEVLQAPEASDSTKFSKTPHSMVYLKNRTWKTGQIVRTLEKLASDGLFPLSPGNLEVV